MKKQYLSLLLCLFWISLYSQDAYHTNLQQNLQSTYSLPSSTWVLPNTETETFNVDYFWGSASTSALSASNQDFSQKTRTVVSLTSGAQWNSGYGIQNSNTITFSDACLFVIWLRADDVGKVSL